VVTRIDGRDARNLGIEPVVGLLRGHRGTSVTIEVQRAGVKRSFTITRA
jgi:C-terminal processing protease CtpA/Prc